MRAATQPDPERQTPPRAGSGVLRTGRVGRTDSGAPRAPQAPLRDGWVELACALAFVREAWADAPLLPLEWLTGSEARGVLRAVAELREAGEDVTLEAVSRRCRLPLALLDRLADDHWDADVPGLRRRLRRVRARRVLALLADALRAADADDDVLDIIAADAVAATCRRVGALLAALEAEVVA